MTDSDAREPLPDPMFQSDYGHLIPIAKVLIRRGHLPIRRRPKYGFCPGQGGTTCWLTHALTGDDWDAVTARFVIPDHIVYRFGMIRDHVNGVQIQGNDAITTDDGSIPIEDWITRQDWSDLPADVASAAPQSR